MDITRLQEAISELRQAISDTTAGRCSTGEAAEDRLFRVACDIVTAIGEGEGMKQLQDRAKKYSATFQSEIFQQMCDLATHAVLETWHRSGSLPVHARQLILSADKVDDGMRLLDRLIPRHHIHQDLIPPEHAHDSPAMSSLATTISHFVTILTLLSFLDRQDGQSVGQRLPNFVKSLKQLSASLGRPYILRRVIIYFESIIEWADKDHLWGSLWLYGCHSMDRSADPYHYSKLHTKWLARDPQGIATAMLAAVEDLVKRLVPGEVAISTAQETDCEQLEMERDNEQPKYSWHKMDEDPPEGRYHNDPFQGSLWQIAWALGEAKVIGDSSNKVLNNSLRHESLWGQKAGSVFFVYVTKKTRQELIDRARTILEAILARGPYRPVEHPLPAVYKKHSASSLTSPSEEILAQVLHEAGILKDSAVLTMRNKVHREGVLFGKFGGGSFTIFLHDKHPFKTVKKACLALQQRQGTPTT